MCSLYIGDTLWKKEVHTGAPRFIHVVWQRDVQSIRWMFVFKIHGMDEVGELHYALDEIVKVFDRGEADSH